jgi:hypothetical protein
MLTNCNNFHHNKTALKINLKMIMIKIIKFKSFQVMIIKSNKKIKITPTKM